MDLIDRQKAIDALIWKIRPHNNGDGTITMCVMSEELVRKTLDDLPSAQPEHTEERTETHACDCISRRAAIEALDALCDRECEYSKKQRSVMCGACHLGSAFDVVEQLPSAQPERLTDDDFEAIRIHLNAYKEKLCNQQRWEEAGEYQRIIDRFMAFASAQPEIVRCKDCRHGVDYYHEGDCYCSNPKWGLEYFGGSWEFYCADAERRTDENNNE